jgi:hypothetical protein
MANGIAGIDHVLVGVADLEAARQTWRRLGFVVTPRGRHIGWGTANYCIMFPDDYVELLGIVDATQYVAGLDTLLAQRGEGLLRLSLATFDADGAHAELAAHGLSPQPVQDLKRELELPEGTVLPRFKLVHLPADTVPGLPLFLCHHLTPDLLRRPDWLLHPNGATGIAAMTVVVDDPPALQAACEKLFGAGSSNLTDHLLAVITGQAAILFVRPDDLESILPDLPVQTQATPWIASLTFAVPSLEPVGLALTANRVPFVDAGDDMLRVAPQYANGCVVEFQARG